MNRWVAGYEPAGMTWLPYPALKKCAVIPIFALDRILVLMVLPQFSSGRGFLKHSVLETLFGYLFVSIYACEFDAVCILSD